MSKPANRHARMGRRLALLAAAASLWVLGPAAAAVADPPAREEFTIPLTGLHFLSSFCGFTIVQDGPLT